MAKCHTFCRTLRSGSILNAYDSNRYSGRKTGHYELDPQNGSHRKFGNSKRLTLLYKKKCVKTFTMLQHVSKVNAVPV